MNVMVSVAPKFQKIKIMYLSIPPKHLKPLSVMGINKYCVHFLLFTLFSFASFLTTAQNGCLSPDSIFSLPFNHDAPTCGIDVFDESMACKNTSLKSNDYTFYFKPDASNNCIKISPVVADAPGVTAPTFFIFDGCPSADSTHCIDQIRFMPAGFVYTYPFEYTLVPGREYYFVFSSETGCYDFSLLISNSTNPCVDPLGSNCHSAHPIAQTPFVDTLTSICNLTEATDFLNVGNNIAHTDGLDYLYSYTPPADECVYAKLKNSLAYNFFLYEKCPTDTSNGTIVVTEDNYFDEEAYIQYNMLAGNTYYFVVECFSPYLYDCTDLEFKMAVGNGNGQNCANAIALVDGDFLSFESVSCKGDDFSGNDLGSMKYGAGNDGVYKFTVANESCVSMALFDIIGDLAMLLYDDCPSSGNLIGGDSTRVNLDKSMGLEFNLLPGEYWLVVAADLFSDFNSYDISLEFKPPSQGAIGCAGADPIAGFPFLNYPINTECKTKTFDPRDLCNPFPGNKQEYTLQFSSAGNECIEILAENIVNSAEIFLIEGCPSEPTSQCMGNGMCPVDSCPSLRLEFNLVNPGDYYIVVGSKEVGKSVDLNLSVRSSVNDSCIQCNNNVCDVCGNMNLDAMSLAGWEGSTGDVNNTAISPGLVTGSLNEPFLAQHVLVGKEAVDVKLGDLLACTPPNGSDYAMKLGNYDVNAKGEKASFEFEPTEAFNNLIYWYAVVFQDPGHTPEEQPYFSIKMFRESGEEITCAGYEVRAGQGIPGFVEFPEEQVLWKDWTAVSIPLNDFIGEKITIEFENKDCSRGGHYGYSYLDLECTTLELIQVDTLHCLSSDSALIRAPLGYASYVWSTGETSEEIYIDSGGYYSVSLTTVSGCVTELLTEIVEEGAVNFGFEIQRACGDTQIVVIDTSFVVGTADVDSRIWTLPDGSQVLDKDTITFSASDTGTYYLHLTAGSSIGCFRDTTIAIPVSPFIYSLDLVDSIHVCTGDSVVLEVDNQAGTFVWSGPISAGDTNRVVVPIADPSYNGLSYLQLFLDTCRIDIDSVFVQVDRKSQPTLSGSGVVCSADSARITGIPNAFNAFQVYWSSGQQGVNSIVPLSTATYWYYVETEVCLDSASFDIQVDPMPGISLSDVPELCDGDSAFLEIIPEFYDFVQWMDGYNGLSRMWGDSGEFTFQVFSESCVLDSSFYVKINPIPTLELSGDTVFCPLDVMRVSVVDISPGVDFLWFNGSAARDRIVYDAGTYIGTAFEGPCFARDTLVVDTFPTLPELPYIPVCPDTVFEFNPGNYYPDYFWLTGDSSGSRDLMVNDGLSYVAISLDGCYFPFETWGIKNDTCEQQIFVANSFSPDGDNINDLFFPVHYKGEVLGFRIYDRWGAIVYATEDASPWDGNFASGEQCRPDVYVWWVLYADRYKRNKIYKGHVTLLR